MFLPLALAALTAASPGPRRFALVLGENHGMEEDVELQYAVEDARRVRDTLVDVGEVQPKDAHALLGANAIQLRDELARLEDSLRKEARPQDQLVVYVSSHADEGDLRLQGTRFPMRELQDFLRRVPVAVAILVVDSCRSGTLTRVKGLKPVAGADVAIEAPELNGRIVMTSSTADELSQESARLSGSYFTHHLLSGLRGAADTSGDGLVTLQEAYAYAYARTVENTFGSRAGIQHPSYSVDLKGRGDLVLSEPAKGRSRLLLTSEVSREWLIVGPDLSSQVALLVKATGPALFAVRPGSYRVRARLAEGYREALVAVAEGQSVEVSDAQLGPLEREGSRSKGPPPQFAVGLGPTLAASMVNGLGPMVGGEARFEYRPWGHLGPFQWLGATLEVTRGQALGAVYFREVEVLFSAGPGFDFHFGWLRLSVGPEIGLTLARQDLLPGGERRVGLQPHVGGRGSIDFRLSPHWTLRASGLFGVGYLRSELGPEARPVIKGTLQVMYEFP